MQTAIPAKLLHLGAVGFEQVPSRGGENFLPRGL